MMGMVRKSPEFLFETMSTVNFIIQCKDMKLREPTQFSYDDILDSINVNLVLSY